MKDLTNEEILNAKTWGMLVENFLLLRLITFDDLKPIFQKGTSKIFEEPEDKLFKNKV